MGSREKNASAVHGDQGEGIVNGRTNHGAGYDHHHHEADPRGRPVRRGRGACCSSASRSRTHSHLDVTLVTTTEWKVRQNLKLVMAVASLIGITGMYLRQVRQTGLLGLLGYLVFGAGYLMMTSVEAPRHGRRRSRSRIGYHCRTSAAGHGAPASRGSRVYARARRRRSGDPRLDLAVLSAC